MYMAKIQEVLTAESIPTFNVELLEKVQSNDDHNVFATKRQHSEQPESINDTYVLEKFENDQFALILRYRDLVQGKITIKRVYYVEGLNHNLFSLGQFCDADLEHRRLSHLNSNTINFLSKKDTVNGLPKLKYVKDQLCSSCELGKAKKSTFKKKTIPSSKGWYVVPTGRVVVPTGRYVVPAGNVIIIVSPGRLSLVPTGRVLSLGRVK
ncbi:retrovirus-related pol polyprotein from transposon TNT 1-94 [Tanacetum coccineum]